MTTSSTPPHPLPAYGGLAAAAAFESTKDRQKVMWTATEPHLYYVFLFIVVAWDRTGDTINSNRQRRMRVLYRFDKE